MHGRGAPAVREAGDGAPGGGGVLGGVLDRSGDVRLVVGGWGGLEGLR